MKNENGKVKIIRAKEEDDFPIPQPTNNPTDAQILSALAKNMGMFYLACRDLDMTEAEVKARLKNNPQIAAEYFAITQRIGDNVERSLIEKALDGEQKAIEFYLNAKHKDRGYGKQSQSGNRMSIAINGGNVSITKEEITQQVQELQQDFLKSLEEPKSNPINLIPEKVEIIDVTKKENDK